MTDVRNSLDSLSETADEDRQSAAYKAQMESLRAAEQSYPTKPESDWEAIGEARRLGLSVHMYGSNDTGEPGWVYWHIENRDLQKRLRIWKPWKVYFAWYGFEKNPNRLWGLPLGIHCFDSWEITWRKWRGYREGVGNTPTEALSTYFCGIYGDELCEQYNDAEDFREWCEGCPLDWPVELPCGNGGCGCDCGKEG